MVDAVDDEKLRIMKQLGIGIYPEDVDYGNVLMPIIRQVIPKRIAEELVGVQPMNDNAFRDFIYSIQVCRIEYQFGDYQYDCWSHLDVYDGEKFVTEEEFIERFGKDAIVYEREHKQPYYVLDKTELLELVNEFTSTNDCTGYRFGVSDPNNLIDIIKQLPDTIHVSKICQIIHDDLMTSKMVRGANNLLEKLIREINKIRIKVYR